MTLEPGIYLINNVVPYGVTKEKRITLLSHAQNGKMACTTFWKVPEGLSGKKGY